jgi:hypothetical protein
MPKILEVNERLSVPVSRDTADALRRIASREEVSVAALVRRSIRLLLAQAADRQEIAPRSASGDEIAEAEQRQRREAPHHE